MEKYREVEGDLFEFIFAEKFDITLQGCNCFNTQGAGICIPFKKYFNTDTFQMELYGKGDINKLGQIDYKSFYISKKRVYNIPIGHPEITHPKITVVNCYSQYHYGCNHDDGVKMPIDYEALTLCLRKINHCFKGLRIGLPAIGAGLAGGNLNLIRTIIQRELKDCYVTLVLFKK